MEAKEGELTFSKYLKNFFLMRQIENNLLSLLYLLTSKCIPILDFKDFNCLTID